MVNSIIPIGLCGKNGIKKVIKDLEKRIKDLENRVSILERKAESIADFVFRR